MRGTWCPSPCAPCWPWPKRILFAAIVSGSLLLGGCSTRPLLVGTLADEWARQAGGDETDPVLAREASAFYLKVGEGLLAERPDHVPLAVAVAGGLTQYAFGFVAQEADRIERADPRLAQAQRDRAAALYRRAHRQAMRTLQLHLPTLQQVLKARDEDATPWPPMPVELVPLAYWAAASWGAAIGQSKGHSEALAEVPEAHRLARWAYRTAPRALDGGVAALMASFEAARPGGSSVRTRQLLDEADAAAAGRQASVWVSRAELLDVPSGDRDRFTRSLQQAIAVAQRHPSLPNTVFRARAEWLLTQVDDLF